MAASESRSLIASVDDKFASSVISANLQEGVYLILRSETVNNYMVTIAKLSPLRVKEKEVDEEELVTENKLSDGNKSSLSPNIVMIATSDTDNEKYFLFYNNTLTVAGANSEEALKRIQYGVESYCLNKTYQLINKIVLPVEKSFIIAKKAKKVIKDESRMCLDELMIPEELMKELNIDPHRLQRS